MNGNNDNERPRISSRDASPNHVRSAFVRRDDGPLASDETTADAYLRSIVADEQASAPRVPMTDEEIRRSQAPSPEEPASVRSVAIEEESEEASAAMPAVTADDEVMAPEPAIAIEPEMAASLEVIGEEVVMEMPSADDRATASQTSSALTRDAARLRSIMRQAEPGADRSPRASNAVPVGDTRRAEASVDAAPSHQPIPQVADTVAEIPLPSVAPSAASVHVPAIDLVAIPEELDVMRAGHPERNAEPRSTIDTIVQPAAPAADARAHVVDAIAELDEMMTTAMFAPAEEPRVDVIEMESVELVNELDAAYEDQHASADTVAIMSGTPVVETISEIEAVAVPEATVVEAEPVSEMPSGDIPIPGEIIAAISDELRLVRRTVARTQEIPAPPPITEEARRAATKLKAPEPRRSDVSISRQIKIGAARTEEKRVGNRIMAHATAGASGAATAQAGATVLAAARSEMPSMQAGNGFAPEPRRSAQTVTEIQTRQAATGASTPRADMHAELGYGGRPPRPAERIEPQTTWIDERPVPPQAHQTDVPQPAAPRTRPEIVDPYDAEFQQKKKLVIAVSSVTLGVIIALGLYAGGGDAITGLFSNRTEGINKGAPRATSIMTSTMPVTEPAGEAEDAPKRDRVVTSPVVESATAATSATAKAADVEKKSSASAVQAEKPKAEKVSAEKKSATPVRTVSDGKSREEGARSAAVSAEKTRRSDAAAAKTKAEKATKADKEKKLAAAPEKKKDGSSSAQTQEKDAKKVKGSEKYTIQVRATTDESEAKRLAAKLRSKGMKGVTVVTSGDKEKKLYRIRFGSYGSPTDAKSAAGRAGVDGAWVIKQR